MEKYKQRLFLKLRSWATNTILQISLVGIFRWGRSGTHASFTSLKWRLVLRGRNSLLKRFYCKWKMKMSSIVIMEESLRKKVRHRPAGDGFWRRKINFEVSAPCGDGGNIYMLKYRFGKRCNFSRNLLSHVWNIGYRIDKLLGDVIENFSWVKKCYVMSKNKKSNWRWRDPWNVMRLLASRMAE